MTFEERCQDDPQGVIVDLVAQTTRQAVAIFGQTEQIAKLETELKALRKPKQQRLVGA